MHSRDLLAAAAGHVADFLETLPEGRVEAEMLDADALRARLALPLPDEPILGAAAVHAVLLGWRRSLQDPVEAPSPSAPLVA